MENLKKYQKNKENKYLPLAFLALLERTGERWRHREVERRKVLVHYSLVEFWVNEGSASVLELLPDLSDLFAAAKLPGCHQPPSCHQPQFRVDLVADGGTSPLLAVVVVGENCVFCWFGEYGREPLRGPPWGCSGATTPRSKS